MSSYFVCYFAFNNNILYVLGVIDGFLETATLSEAMDDKTSFTIG